MKQIIQILKRLVYLCCANQINNSLISWLFDTSPLNIVTHGENLYMHRGRPRLVINNADKTMGTSIE